MSWLRGVSFVCLAAVLGGCGSEPDPLPTVGLVRGVRGVLQLSRGEGQDPFSAVHRPMRAEKNAWLVTDEATHSMVDLDNGNWLLLGANSKVQLALESIRFERGKLWVDAPVGSGTKLVTAHGELEAEGASFSVEGGDAAVRVICASGKSPSAQKAKKAKWFRARLWCLKRMALRWKRPPFGMIGRVALRIPRHGSKRQPPTWVWLSGRTFTEWGSAFSTLPTRSYDVRATVLGDYVETVVTQTFFNARSDQLETEYTIRLPQGAVVSGFEVHRGNGRQRGRIAPMEQGDRYTVPWNPRETATSRLVYDGPEQLRARISPVEAGSTVRVALTYGQWLDRRGGQRTYVVPMRSDGPAALIGELSIRVDTTRAGAAAYRAGMGAKVAGHQVVFRASDIKPRSDFYLDLIDEEAPTEDTVFAYEEGESSGAGAERGDHNFLLLDVPTSGIADVSEEEKNGPVDLVLLVDASGGTSDEDLELARASVDTVLRLLSKGDRVAIRLADVDARVPADVPEELTEVTPSLREQLVAALSRSKRSGATDLAASLRSAAQLLRGRPNGIVLYLGDGLPTTGALTKTEIHERLAAIPDPPRFFALGLGEGVNQGLLRSLFKDRFVQATSEREAARAAARILADLAQPVLRGLSFSLGEDIERVYPSGPLEAELGSHVRLVGRIRGALPEEVSLRGTYRGEVVERTFPVLRKNVASGGDIARRWATARLAQLLDQNAGREALVELGVRFSILSPWTAFVMDGAASYQPVRGFDIDPTSAQWDRGGGAPGFDVYSGAASAGWRRRIHHTAPAPTLALFDAWQQRVQATSAPAPTGDGGLARARVRRVLLDSTQGPEGCFQRKQLVRPDLSGNVWVDLSVSAAGAVTDVSVTQSQLGATDVDDCIAREVAGLRYPATGAAVQLTHTFVFTSQIRTMGTVRECSRASRLELFLRKRLWRERLSTMGGVRGALDLWQRAKLSCELDSWRAKQALLKMLLQHVGPIHQRLALHQGFGEHSEAGRYLRRLIVQDVTDPAEVAAIRSGFGLVPDVDWRVFERDWKKLSEPAPRLKLVDRWLKVLPDDIDLSLRRLSLLQDLERTAEARRLARHLVTLPLCDAEVLTQVGEFWLRQRDPQTARRVFSELVERAPFDPWARMRLGDLYRAHGWHDDAYREYKTLTRLDASNRGAVLSLARAAAGAGRQQEALLLEQALAESSEPNGSLDLAAVARLWTELRLAGLWADSQGTARTAVENRIRNAGILRDPPAASVVLHWSHPDDRPTLHVRYPGHALVASPQREERDGFEPAEIQAAPFGLGAVRIREREPEAYVFEVRREEKDQIRDVAGELLIWIHPGTTDAKVLRHAIILSREQPTIRLRLSPENVLEVIDTP